MKSNMKINVKRWLCTILSLALMLVTSPVIAFADVTDGMVSDGGTNAPLTPDAGTVEGSEGGAISNAVDSASELVSGVVDNASSSAGMSVGAVILVCVLIAVAIAVLVMLLIPRRHE